MHFSGFSSLSKGQASIELMLYLAPQDMDRVLEANSQALLNSSVYKGSGQLALTTALLQQLRSQKPVSQTINIHKIPSKALEDAKVDSAGSSAVG